MYSKAPRLHGQSAAEAGWPSCFCLHKTYICKPMMLDSTLSRTAPFTSTGAQTPVLRLLQADI